MPNWVANKLRVVAGDPKEVFEFICSRQSILDFNNIVPMPPDVCARVAVQEESAPWLTLRDGSKVQGIPVPPGSYRDQWNQENWGTKWNAEGAMYSLKAPDRVILFNTAWDPPVHVFEALSKRFPHHEIVIWSREPNMLINVKFIVKAGTLRCGDRRRNVGAGERRTENWRVNTTDELVAKKLHRSYSPVAPGSSQATRG